MDGNERYDRTYGIIRKETNEMLGGRTLEDEALSRQRWSTD